MLGNHDHSLLVLIRDCLHNHPAHRPDAGNIKKKMEELRKECQGDPITMDKLHLIKKLKEVQSDFDELQVNYNL